MMMKPEKKEMEKRQLSHILERLTICLPSLYYKMPFVYISYRLFLLMQCSREKVSRKLLTISLWPHNTLYHFLSLVSACACMSAPAPTLENGKGRSITKFSNCTFQELIRYACIPSCSFTTTGKTTGFQ